MIFWADPPTPAQEAQAQRVLAAHDPTPRPDPRPATLERIRAYRAKPVRTPVDDRAALDDLIDYLGIQ